MIVYGSRMMGKCDAVPGFFHVATKFQHIYYLPLIPTKTYIVLSTNGNTFRGVVIPMSFKSILLAWSRTILFLVALGTLCSGIQTLMDSRHARTQQVVAVLSMILTSGLFAFVTWHRACTRASFTRASELARLAGFNEAAFARLHTLYGESAGRGFEVISSQPVQPVIPTAQSAIPAPATAAQATYPCRACGMSATADQAYTESDGRTICKSCWSKSTAAAEPDPAGLGMQ